MTIRLSPEGVIELAGRCEVDDAEALQRHLLAAPESTVKWSDCEYLHSAVIQVLLVGRPRVRGAPSNAFLKNHIAPLVLHKRGRNS
jgi:hypothetical protein